jgi:iron complex transport system substrate-binding protein
MRIASLVPSATETLFALGIGDRVAGVTHECDFPPEAASRAHLTRSIIPGDLDAGEIDEAVREAVGAGRALYELDEDALRELGVGLIATQAVCEVCAVSYDDVRAVAERLPGSPEVISLDPVRLADVIADVARLGEAAGAAEEGEALRAELNGRLEAVRVAVAGAERPRVLALEWLDPPFIGGHWIPEMIEIAGGEDALAHAGEKSRTAEWGELAEARPEIVVAMPCGWDSARARLEAEAHASELAALGAERIIAVDAAASFSRPGPRLVEGTELLAHLMHPDRVDAPAGVDFEHLALHEKAET